MQLDLIQHQQEQLLKKDRQLQGLKQDRAALCLRLERQEKRNAFLTIKLLELNKNANFNQEGDIINNKLDATDRVNDINQSEETFSTTKINARTLNKFCNISNKSPNLSQTLYNQNISDNTNHQSLIVKSKLLNNVEISETQSPETGQQINNKASSVKSKIHLKKRNRSSKSVDSDTCLNEKLSLELVCKSTKEESNNETLLNKQPPNKKKKTGSKIVNKKFDQISTEILNTSKPLSTCIPIIETEEPYYLYNCREET